MLSKKLDLFLSLILENCHPLYLQWQHFSYSFYYLLLVKLSHVWLFVTPWTVAYQDPSTIGFSRQESWGGLLFPSPGDLPDPGIEPGSPTLQTDSLPSEPPGAGMGFYSKCDFIPPTILLGLLLCSWTWRIFFGGIQHPLIDGCSAAGCNFGVLAGEDECTSFYSAIFLWHPPPFTV